MGKGLARTLVLPLAAALLAWAGPAAAQRIPADQYLRYVPLELPRAIRQTGASARLGLFGDASRPDYRDEAPRDGIDDARGAILQGLGARFAPILVLNSYAMPMAFSAFETDGPAFPLHIDGWDVSTPTAQLVAQETIDFRALEARPCATDPARSDATSDDCRLLELLRRYHPDDPAAAVEQRRARDPDRDRTSVLWFDFPGGSAEEWREVYEDPQTRAIRRAYQDRLHTYLHPFLVEAPACDGGPGYELVLQYWFFYPFNDGGNNHLGDWEHINVVPTPRDRIGCGLPEDEMRALLDGASLASTGPDELVIARVDYYFHNNVFTLDFSLPNAYLPREAWEAQVEALTPERAGARNLWREVRRRAYRDDAETEVNTHPLGYIGADNKGTDQVLEPPGGSNRDSHGTYPFSGLYTSVGPAGAAEQISPHLDLRDWLQLPEEARRAREAEFTRGAPVSLASPERITVVPDVDRLATLVLQDPAVRRTWAHLLLPVRWGYPAVHSPFAGVVGHAETGNLSPFGLAFNSGWNRAGAGGQYAAYDPHRLPQLFPTRWQDELQNDYGWLNFTLPTLSLLPPFDLVWRIGLAPIRLPLQRNDPKFLPSDDIPVRFVGLGVGITRHQLDPDYLGLIFNREQFPGFAASIFAYLASFDPVPTPAGDAELFVDDAVSAQWQMAFFVGRKFVSENTLRHSRSDVGFTQEFVDAPPYQLRGDLNMWEYAGSLRYNLGTGTLMPYVKAGYGLSWYRLEDMAANGVELEVPDSPWVRQPTFSDLSSFLPNTWHFGGGVELLALKGRSLQFLPGLDLALKLDWTLYTHNLGIQFEDVPVEDLIAIGIPADELPRDRRIGRQALSLTGTLSF